MYLQRRRKVFLFIIFQVKLFMIVMIHMHRHITSNVSSSHRIVLKNFNNLLGRPVTHFPVKLGPVYGLRIRLIFQTQTSLQYYPTRA
jgi:hypothetical protein